VTDAAVVVVVTARTVEDTAGTSAIAGASVLGGGANATTACDVFGPIAPTITNANAIQDAAIDTSHQRDDCLRRRVPGRPAFGTARTLEALSPRHNGLERSHPVRVSKHTATSKTWVHPDEQPGTTP